jgi:hypothetical protein
MDLTLVSIPNRTLLRETAIHEVAKISNTHGDIMAIRHGFSTDYPFLA